MLMVKVKNLTLEFLCVAVHVCLWCLHMYGDQMCASLGIGTNFLTSSGLTPWQVLMMEVQEALGGEVNI